MAIALSEFHMLLVYKDRVIAVCHLNDMVVFEESAPVVRVLYPVSYRILGRVFYRYFS